MRRSKSVKNGLTNTTTHTQTQRMVRHILTGVSLALLVLTSATFAEDSSNTLLSVPSSPFQSDIAFQFFDIGSELSYDLRNVTATSESARKYDDDQCTKDIDRVLAGMRSYNEWALKCKHLFLFTRKEKFDILVDKS